MTITQQAKHAGLEHPVHAATMLLKHASLGGLDGRVCIKIVVLGQCRSRRADDGPQAIAIHSNMTTTPHQTQCNTVYSTPTHCRASMQQVCVDGKVNGPVATLSDCAAPGPFLRMRTEIKREC
jgi:hypothetical protein